MRSQTCTFLALSMAWLSSYGQTSSVSGSGSGYAGESLYVTIARNPFLRVNEYSKGLVCDEEGSFELDIPLEAPGVVQFESGMYQAYLFMEPGYHYRVSLPDYRETDRDSRISPFYQPVVIPLPVVSRSSHSRGMTLEGSEEINASIATFDSRFSEVNKDIILQRRKGLTSNMDSIIGSLELEYRSDSSSFFSSYRKYRYGVLILNEGKTALESISRDYLGPEVMEWHPGFVELFRSMFKDFIFYYSQSDEGKDLRQLINRSQDLEQTRKLVRKHPAVWNDTLTDMILIQEFSELYYRGDYHKKALLILLDSIAADPVSPEFGTFAVQVKDKLASLEPGNAPPPISLEDLDGNLCTLEQFRGKYTYLLFGTPDHYGCMMEYPFLQSYQEKHSDYLNVVTIMASEEKSELEEFMKRNAYTWKALHYEFQPGVLTDYQVRAYPTAYLIDREGKFLLSPAVLPTDGFEQQFFRIMRSRGEI